MTGPRRLMLDTNTVSRILKGPPAVLRERLAAAPPAALCVSAITEGELRFGLARRPEAVRLAQTVGAFLQRIEVLAWDSAAAARYGALRAALEARGTLQDAPALGEFDTLIAGHALAADAVLVTSDRAFGRVPGLAVDDWTAA